MNSENKVNVAVIGAGPSGVGVATELARRGVKSVLLIERNEQVGGLPAVYKKKPGGIVTFISWTRGRVVFGEDYSQWLTDKLAKTDITVWLNSKVTEINPAAKKITIVNPEQGKVDVNANVIILACGARENTAVEFGWLSGARTGRTFFSKNLLELIDQHDSLPIKKPVIVGSDLNAYAMAAKLKSTGASDAAILDTDRRPKTPFYSRLYFRKWNSNPRFYGKINSAKFIGNGAATAVELDNGTTLSCDGIVLSGNLIPNSELALLAHLDVEIPSRKPQVDAHYKLSVAGWFATGNILGGFHGAEWCYLNGKKVAKNVINYLKNS